LLIEVKQAIKEQWGDDGQKDRGGSDYSSGPDGFDRIRYEIVRIAEAIYHSTIDEKAAEVSALIPAELPRQDGRYVPVISGGVLSREEE
jgi:hypothetical protein